MHTFHINGLIQFFVNLGFVVPCIFKYSNKTPNQMHQSVVTFIVQSHRRRSTCFGHYRAHHQELFQTAVAASGCRVNAEVVVFPAVVGLLTCWATSMLLNNKCYDWLVHLVGCFIWISILRIFYMFRTSCVHPQEDHLYMRFLYGRFLTFICLTARFSCATFAQLMSHWRHTGDIDHYTYYVSTRLRAGGVGEKRKNKCNPLSRMLL
jgi:hypothetical protein